MKEYASLMNAAVAGADPALAVISKNDFAAQTENPQLWLRKYDFYVDHLGFTSQEAIRWANRTVRLDDEIKQALTSNGNNR